MELQQLRTLMAQVESAIEEATTADQKRKAETGTDSYMEAVYQEIGDFHDRVCDLKRQYAKIF